MNRNQNSHFALNPTNIDMQRSQFDRSCTITTSFNVGDIIPFFVDEVLPGDTFSIDTSKVVRLQTPITPFMGNIYLDTYYFFVPNRLVWDHWKEFNGENTESAWIPRTEYSVPSVVSPQGGWDVGTIADYMGLPVNVDGIYVNAMPFRGYALIMNEWFRDQNLTDPLDLPCDETTLSGSNGGNYITDVVRGGKPFKAAKYFDYFTSCLPAPQKGPDVLIDLVQQDLPVYGSRTLGMNLTDGARFGSFVGFVPSPDDSSFLMNAAGTDNSLGTSVDDLSPGTLNGVLNLPSESDGVSSNVYAKLANLSVFSINELRMAFQIQKLYEKDARGGTRYIEILKSHFGVTSPDARLQRPEYLGGNRVPINVHQVIQQSATMSGTTPQGNVSAMSLTVDTSSDFTRSFVEHGFVFGLMVARYDHLYQQGIERFWSRGSRFDYYWPVLANIGEQAVLRQEIFADGSPQDLEVFGYNEAWADYRYKPSRVTGEMRSAAANSLDSWHLADDYEFHPELSDAWIREDKSNVDRVLAVQSSVSNQLFADIYVKNKTTRPMPMYSIPGLIDHH